MRFFDALSRRVSVMRLFDALFSMRFFDALSGRIALMRCLDVFLCTFSLNYGELLVFVQE